MRNRIIAYLKANPKLARLLWAIARLVLRVFGWFVPVRDKTIIFCSFGGRNFNDSPRAVYEEVCKRKEFDDWKLIWAFADPDKHELFRGEKLKVDTPSFFYALLYSKVWVSNSGMDRGIDLKRKCNIRVETWHGAPLKRIGGEEYQNSLGEKPRTYKGKLDSETIRCAQSEYDRAIFERIFHADKTSILLCDLPRNDSLFNYSSKDVDMIKKQLGINDKMKVILYAPTYREYLLNEDNETYLSPPIDLGRWEKELGEEYVLLIRAHYAVTSAMNVKQSSFVKDVSNYSDINDLYIISDMIISDYSSSFIDFSILNRPMLCFAYDLEEYELKRGLYLKLEETLPCEIDFNEEALLNHISNLDYMAASERTRHFHHKFAPNAGSASKTVVDAIISRLC